jgi:competence protein ComEC
VSAGRPQDRERKVLPELAVASVGKGNSFGHPGSQTLALLERSRIPLVESDGRRWWVVGRQDTARGPPAVKGRPKPGGDADARPAGRRIKVNTATESELESLPGVGPVIARRIIEGRPYRSVDDLDRVKGIGKKRLEEIRPLVSVE